MTRRSPLTTLAFAGMGLYLLIFLATVAFPLIPESISSFRLAMGVLLISCLLHSADVSGLQTTVVLLLWSSIVGWSAEQLAISHGIVFPPYRYGEELGGQLGSVPWIIPPSWFIFAHSASFVARRIAARSKNNGGSARQAVICCFYGALIMACLDLALEPFAVLRGYWIWNETGHFFKTQSQVFVGWLFWGSVVQAGMYRWNAQRRTGVVVSPPDRRQRMFPVLVLLAVGLYASWITTREWSPYFALLSLSSLGPFIFVGLGRGNRGTLTD